MDIQKLIQERVKQQGLKDAKILGQDTDMTSSEVDNMQAEQGTEETLKTLGAKAPEESSMSKDDKKKLAGAAGDIIKAYGRSNVADTVPMKNEINVRQPQDVMAARKNALMQLLKR